MIGKFSILSLVLDLACIKDYYIKKKKKILKTVDDSWYLISPGVSEQNRQIITQDYDQMKIAYIYYYYLKRKIKNDLWFYVSIKIKYILCVSKNLFVKNIIFNKRNLFSLSLWVKFKCIYVPIYISISLL